MLPRNYLLTAPLDAATAFGVGMQHDVLVKGLRECNLNVSVPLPDSYPHWYPGKANGQTTIWIGPPFEATSRKVCAFHIGEIPEFTQVDDKGNIIRRGWRAILEKCIKAGVASKRRIESKFSVILDYAGPDRACWKCRMSGKIRRATCPGPLCDLHSEVQKTANKAVELKKEKAWLRQAPQHQKDQYLTPQPKQRVRVRLGRKSCLRMGTSSSRARKGSSTI